MATENKCFICEKSISSHDVAVVKEKGIKTLLRSSIERKDNKHVHLNVESLKVPRSCRKNYTRASSIKAALRIQISSAETDTEEHIESLQSSPPQFDFREKCLFCTEEINDEFHQREKKKAIDRRRKVSNVRNILLKKNILQAAEKRNDKWGQEVKARLSNVADLSAANAMYHHTCFVAFFRQVSSSSKRGRPQADEVTAAMEEIYNYRETMNSSQVSLPDLMSQCTEYVPADTTVKMKLKEKYGDNIIITPKQKPIPMIYFRGTGQKILSDSCDNAGKKDEPEERLRIAQTAAEIIREDIQSQVYECSCLASSDDFLKDTSRVIPETLNVFLENLLTMKKNTTSASAKKKITSIGHTLISAIRPQMFLLEED